MQRSRSLLLSGLPVRIAGLLIVASCLELGSASGFGRFSLLDQSAPNGLLHQQLHIAAGKNLLARNEARIASLTGKKVLDHLNSIKIPRRSTASSAKLEDNVVASNPQELIEKRNSNSELQSRHNELSFEGKNAVTSDVKLAAIPNAAFPEPAAVSEVPTEIKKADEPTALEDVASHGTLAAQLHAVHQKAMAKKRLGAKAQTDNSDEAKSSADAVAVLPWVLPPVGAVFLGAIAYAVITIRNWQKIPSMPTQGRMDIEAVRASAQRAGGRAYSGGGGGGGGGSGGEAREMRHATGGGR